MDKKEKYPLINQLINNMTFKKLKYLPTFNEFNNFMLKNYSFNISREEAKHRNLKTEIIYKDNQFSEKFLNFMKVWKFMKNDSIIYKCYSKMPIKNLNIEDKLAYFLNDDKEIGYGMYCAAAFENFIEYQNTFLNPVINSYKSKGILHHFINKINRQIQIQNSKKIKFY